MRAASSAQHHLDGMEMNTTSNHAIPRILSWQGPQRSLKPPKVQLWFSVSIIVASMLLVHVFASPHISPGNQQSFNIAWTTISVTLTSALCYLSFTRHLKRLAALMASVSTMEDMDLVVEYLQGGRFARFQEVYHVQTQIIKMFCRLLKDHHSRIPLDKYVFPLREGFLGTQTEDTDEDYTENDDALSMSSALSHEDVKCGTPALSSRHRKGSGRNPDPLGDSARTWKEVLSLPHEVPVSSSLLMQLINQIKLGDDLSKVTLPVHILEPRSLLEKLSDLFIHPDVFISIHKASSPVLRMMAVMRWYMSGFHMRPHGVKKPYNSVLGETFEATFPIPGSEDDYVYFLAEQVSHHPPCSVFHASHALSGTSVTASYHPRSKLVSLNVGASVGEGSIVLSLPNHRETYKMTWPCAYVSGIIAGKLQLELGGEISFTCLESSVRGKICFLRQGWFDTARDMVKGKVWREEMGENLPEYVIDGQWHTVMHQYDFSYGCGKGPKDCQLQNRRVFFDASHDDVSKPVRPQTLPTLDPKPSRIVWEEVTKALRSGDASGATKAKEVVEKVQRSEVRSREAQCVEYFPLYFRIMGGHQKKAEDDVWCFIGKEVRRESTPTPSTTRASTPTPSEAQLRRSSQKVGLGALQRTVVFDLENNGSRKTSTRPAPLCKDLVETPNDDH